MRRAAALAAAVAGALLALLLLASAPAHAAYGLTASWSPPASAGSLTDPAGVATDTAGNVYVVDYGNDRVVKFAANGSFVTAWGAQGSGAGQFDQPFGIVVDNSSGTVYVSDSGQDRIERFTTSGTYLGTIGQLGSGDGDVHTPLGMAVDATGVLYVADAANNRIEKFAANGSFLGKFGSLGSGNGQLSFPYDVAISELGNVYVADSENDRIEEFTATGGFVRAFGRLGSVQGQFDAPLGVATDPRTGDVWVADRGDSPVQHFTASGGFVESWWRGTTLKTDSPASVDVQANGLLYVTDTRFDQVERLAPEPVQATAPVPSATASKGVHSLSWSSATNRSGDPLTYALQHRDANDANWSTVATGLTTTSFAFGAGAPESEGTQSYRVVPVIGPIIGVPSPGSTSVAVDRVAPSAPSVSADRSP